MRDNTGTIHPKTTSNEELPRAQAIPLVQLLVPSTMALPPPDHPQGRPHQEELQDFGNIIDEVLALLDQDDMFEEVDIFDFPRREGNPDEAANGDMSSANQ